jgi:exonuclease SbcC
MKLNSLLLQNIRSYTDHSIDFVDGISLFEGDIGSGKSSILNAIEFALFGLGNLSGTHLLRVGETSGRVELTIEVNDMEYTFGRSLRRRRSRVSQDECFIVEDGVKTHYNATDMKRRALQILNFREPISPRSHSVIYRFAIFTPQDQMKEVISQRPDRRKETLRKAF